MSSEFIKICNGHDVDADPDKCPLCLIVELQAQLANEKEEYELLRVGFNNLDLF